MYNIHNKIPQNVSRLYNNLGLKARWYIYLRWMLSHCNEMERYIPLESKVLDVGCGYGLFVNLVALKSDKRYVVGVDTSNKRISIAIATAKNRNNIEFIEKGIEEIDVGAYDIITFSDVLHHFSYDKQEEFLSNIYKQIKPGSVVMIKELDTQPFWKYLLSYTLDTVLYLGQKISYRSMGEWKDMLGKIGFNVEVVPLHKDTILSSILYICKK